MKKKVFFTLTIFIWLAIFNPEAIFASVDQIGATLTINDEITSTSPPGSIGGGSSGGSKKSGENITSINNKNSEKKCRENWICTNWSDCINNIQTISCYDSNKCNTFENMPKLEIECKKVTDKKEMFGSKEIPEVKTTIVNNLIGISILAVTLGNILYLFIIKNRKIINRRLYKEKYSKRKYEKNK